MDKQKNGFTFIEILIAVLMISILATAVYATFAQGLKLWQRAGQEQPALEMELFLEKVISDLRNALLYDSSAFSGDGRFLQFYRLAARSVSAETGSPEEKISVPVRLRYEANPEAKIVLRKEESYPRILFPKTELPVQEKVVASGIGLCLFEYYGWDEHRKIFEWRKRWIESYLPVAVKVSLEHGSLPGRRISRIIPLFPGQNAG